MRNWLFILILIVLFILYKKKEHNQSVNLTTYTAVDSLQIEKNPWELLTSIEPEDTNNIFKVVWDQKYGITKTSYCLAIFENVEQDQYKLIAPWLNTVIIEKQNIININFYKVNKDIVTDCCK